MGLTVCWTQHLDGENTVDQWRDHQSYGDNSNSYNILAVPLVIKVLNTLQVSRSSY